MTVLFRLLLAAAAVVGGLLAVMAAFPSEPFTHAARSLGCAGDVSYEVADRGGGVILAVSSTGCPASLAPEALAKAAWTASTYDVDFVSATIWRGWQPADTVMGAAELKAVTGVELAGHPRPAGRIGPGTALSEVAARVVPVLALAAAGCAALRVRRVARELLHAGTSVSVRR
ncbi:hypothetical protein [Pseudonocardia oroxyli]|uniref:Uncharacterized protein n=1 Tax=Pseudonocardia oroxyli TaxID=366584 RepID=A0A1G7WY10_PSEOR|nr:hypothetical protein [Pseudonocardia oroxyli]SDG76813.1 hypothetical protein SAMN05216377_11519 [Pseudonocardia oroxyli]